MAYNRRNLSIHLSLFFLSVGVIALQMALMQALSVTKYSHFSYLVISTALLGFGASGTFLYLLEERILARVSFWFTFFFFTFTVSVPLCYLAAQYLPLDIRYLFYTADQLFLYLVYVLLIFIPFFAGASLIGLSLTYFHEQVQSLYGANLLGSGVGGIVVLALMLLVPGSRSPLFIGSFGLTAFGIRYFTHPIDRFSDRRPSFSLRHTLAFAIAVIVSIMWGFISPDIPISRYKPLYRLHLLESQGDAEHILSRYGPRAQIDVFDSDTMHQTLFAGIQGETVPPAQLSLLMDGEGAGSIFKTKSIEDTTILDYTPQSIAYRLFERPNVLLLGEIDGVNIWLAKRWNAESITVVQDNPQLIEILTHELAQPSGSIFTDPAVEIIEQHPRHFLDTTDERFDIVQFVGAEAMVAETQGLLSLHENYMLTVESFQSALRVTRSHGYITITRGLQSPPRDNIKIFATALAALEREHRRYKDGRGGCITEPGEHLLAGRNYLAVNTIFSPTPIDQERIARYQSICNQLGMDTEYYPGIVSSTIEQINTIEGPENKPYSYLHYAYSNMVKGQSKTFYRDWAYDVRPATDNSPYFHNFFTWKSLDRFIEAYGNHWFARTELGYMVLIITFIEVTVIAFLLILLPLLVKRTRTRNPTATSFTILFFGSIGFGFMFLEMTFLQKFGKFLGDPLFSVACALTALMVSSGLGSMLQKRIHQNLFIRILGATVMVTAIAGAYLFILDPLLSLFAGFSTWIRFIITILCLSPISFFMGFFFSSGMTVLREHSVGLSPFAWGVNGFASVSASPLAVILSTASGFKQVIVIAVFLYIIAGLSMFLLPRRGQ